MRYALIFGAGKQGRGVLAYLCNKNNLEPVFIDSDASLISELKQAKQYQITLLQDGQKKHVTLPCHNCIHHDHTEEIARYFKDAYLVFTSSSTKHLRQVGESINAVWTLLYRQGYKIEKNIILCENGSDKIAQFKSGLFQNMNEEMKAQAQSSLGICEALSMSLAIQPIKDSLAICIQEQMLLFIYKHQMKKDLLDLKGIRYVDNFDSLRKQALYTNNTSSAFVSYLAHLMGYETLKEAMKDEVIKQRLTTCYEEINQTLIKDLGVSPSDQREFAQFALRKYENSEDRIDRHTREVLRKLGREERLTGICERALKNGIIPESISLALAAALFYRDKKDPESMQLAQLCDTHSLPDVLHIVCNISPDDPLVELIRNHLRWLVEHAYLCHDEIVTKFIND